MSKKSIKTWGAVLMAIAALLFGSNQFSSFNGNVSEDVTVYDLFKHRISGQMIYIEGEIVKILPDDNKGSRHQRFIVGLDGNFTVLIAHNIDLAPKAPIQKGGFVQIYGQYEWNEKGGVIHWTHDDDRGNHEGGWVMYQGKKYK